MSTMNHRHFAERVLDDSSPKASGIVYITGASQKHNLWILETT
jgi:hypothetical protein